MMHLLFPHIISTHIAILPCRIYSQDDKFQIIIFSIAVCMLERIFWHLCTEKRVPVDLTCCDSGIHLRKLRSADLHHHSHVSGCYCYYQFSNRASHRSCKSVLKLFLLIYDSGRWFSSGNGLFGIPAS